MSNKEYYNVLGINQKASPAEIKQAYKKQALKHHPDKNPENKEQAKEQFKKISEAYTVLSDKRQKEQYDKYGKDGPHNGGGGQQYYGGRPFQPNYGRFDENTRPQQQQRDPFSNLNGFGARGSENDFFNGFHNFTFQRAEEIFREAFGDDELKHAGFFNFDNDPFFSRNKNKNPKSLRNKQFQDEDDFGFGMMNNLHKQMNDHMKGFFGDGLDPFEHMHQSMKRMEQHMNSMSIGMGDDFRNIQLLGNGSGVQGKIYQQSTIMKNGKQVSVAKSSVMNSDGTTNSKVREFVKDRDRVIKDQTYNPSNRIENGNAQSRSINHQLPQYQERVSNSRNRQAPHNALGYGSNTLSIY